MNTYRVLIFIILPFLLLQNIVKGQIGQPDNTFGNNGLVRSTFDLNYNAFYDVAIQADKKIVAGGYTASSYWNAAIARFNPDGSLDESFGNDGKINRVLQKDNNAIFAVAIDSMQRIVIAGRMNSGANGDFMIARLNSDGSLDKTFSSDGIQTINFSGYDEARALIIQPDGKIILGGHGNSRKMFALARVNNDGSLDNTFGSNGKSSVIIGDSTNNGVGLVMQTDGKFYFTGTMFDGSKLVISALRYTSSGVLDTTYSADGLITVSSGYPSTYGARPILQPDGKLLITGHTPIGQNHAVMLTRLHPNGNCDSTFGGDGIVVTPTSAKDYGSSVYYVDGKILVTGYSGQYNYRTFIFRYNLDGTLDNGFGQSGKVYTNQIEELIEMASTFQDDGKLVLVGGSYTDIGADAFVTRYVVSLNAGIVDNPATGLNLSVYPNPIEERTILNFSLNNPSIISVRLLNLEGKVVTNFLENRKMEPGSHSIELQFSGSLPHGSYLIEILTSNGRTALQVIK